MKIYRNKENCKKAWMEVANALGTIQEIFLDNNECDEKTIDAFYTLMKANNDWFDKINEMPF